MAMSSSCWFIHLFFFFNDTATTEIYTLSLHDALPIFGEAVLITPMIDAICDCLVPVAASSSAARSEEHTSELQSRLHLVCRLLLEKKKDYKRHPPDLGDDPRLHRHIVTLAATTFHRDS